MSWFKKSTAFEKLCAGAFVFLATISCLATAQSLSLTIGLKFLPRWLTLVLLFLLAFFVYVLTSYCFKQMIDSHNDKYCAKIHKTVSDRKRMFWGGLLGVLFFWIICSFPTNTHSMVHMKTSNAVAKSELENQLGIFNKAAVKDRNALYNEFYKDSVDMRNDFLRFKDDLDFEVNRIDDKGFGVRARAIVQRVKDRYSNDIKEMGFAFENPRNNMSDQQLLGFYKLQFDNLANQIAVKKHADYIIRRNNFEEEIAGLNNQINKINEELNRLKQDGSSIGNAKELIDDGYNIQYYKKEILDNVEVLKDPDLGHKPSNVVTYNIYRIDRLYSVFNVWGDFFKAKLPKDFDMPYWIVWSAILDIAALIFSGLAFRGKV